MAAVNFISMLSECGMNVLFLREMGKLSNFSIASVEKNNLWSQFLGLKIALTFSAVLAGSAASIWIWPWQKPVIFIGLLAWMFGNALVDFFYQACNALNRVEVSGVIMLIHRGLMVTGVLIVLGISKSLTWVSLALGAGSLLGAVMAFGSIKKLLGLQIIPRWEPRVWFYWLRTSTPLALANIFGSSYIRLGILMMPWLKGEKATGIFGAAFKLFEVGYMIPMAFFVIATPHLSGIYKESSERFWEEARRLAMFVGGLIFIWLIGGQLLAHVVIGWIYGSEFMGSVPVFRVLLAANALVFVNYLIISFMVVTHRLKRHAVNEGLCLLFGAAATCLLVPSHGPLGAAWALVLTEAALTTLTWHSLR